MPAARRSVLRASGMMLGASALWLVRAELDAIRQPGRYFHSRCNLPQRAMILADAV